MREILVQIRQTVVTGFCFPFGISQKKRSGQLRVYNSKHLLGFPLYKGISEAILALSRKVALHRQRDREKKT